MKRILLIATILAILNFLFLPFSSSASIGIGLGCGTQGFNLGTVEPGTYYVGQM